MLDLALVLAFVAYSVTAGFLNRKAASEGLESYFLAGRSMRGWQAGTSMAATQFAVDTPLTAVGLVAVFGIYMGWTFWIYGLAFLLLGLLFGPLWRRARVLTDAELAEVRYGGPGVLTLRVLKAIYYGAVFNSIVLAFVLAASVTVAEAFLPWHEWLPGRAYEPLHAFAGAISSEDGFAFRAPASPLDAATATANNILSMGLIVGFVALYSMTGGLRSVIVTDIAQFALAIIGSIALAIAVVFGSPAPAGSGAGVAPRAHAVGGLSGLRERIPELYPPVAGAPPEYRHAEELLSFVPAGQGVLFAFLLFMSMVWLFQMNSDGTGYLAQRAMSARSERDAKASGIVFAWLQIFLRSLPWLLIGAALLVAYPFTPEEAASAGFTGRREQLFVQAVRDYMPAGYGILGILLVSLLAALASTLDSHLNWGASYFSNDIYKRLICQAWLGREPRGRELVLVARLSNVVVIAIAILIIPMLGSIREAWFISLTLGAGVGSVLVLRWVWERINLWSEIAAMGTSLLVAPVLLWLTFDPPNSPVAALRGMDDITIQAIRLGAVGLTSTAAAVAAALWAPATPPARLDAFYGRVRPPGFWAGSAARAGDRPAEVRGRLWSILATGGLAAISLYLCLYGVARLLLPHPNVPWAFPAGSLGVGIVATPIWWRLAFRAPRQEIAASERSTEAEP